MKLLIVEDEENIAQYLAKNLEAQGHSVDIAFNGSDALDMILEKPYDLITLDIILPGLNGYEVCRAARAEGIEAPILMLTAKDGEYDEVDAFEMGADDFLRKPFSLVVLLARIGSLLRRGARNRTASLEADDLVVDTASRSVTCAGRAVDLTPREYDLLEYLLRNRGAVVSKQELIDYIWGSDYLGSENIVEVYIRYLRKKIDVGGAESRITTVRGIGYMVA